MSDATESSVLLPEHALLGALMGEPGASVAPVLSYPGELAGHDGAEGAALADLSGSCYLLVSGSDTPLLARSALAGRALGVGEAAFEAALSGDGGLISVPLALRTGDGELVVLDVSPRAPILRAWLGFLSEVEQGCQRPFAEAVVEDASGMLVPLLLAGPEASRVLGDYVSSPADLPEPGRVASVSLDRISCLVSRIPDAGPAREPRYLVLVPPTAARVLWRSLLSFPEVDPVGVGRAGELLLGGAPWSAALASRDAVRVSRGELGGWGLLRVESDYVGARGLED